MRRIFVQHQGGTAEHIEIFEVVPTHVQCPLLDLTVYGRQEWWEESPTGWPQPWKDDQEENPYRTDGRPIVQWPRVKAGHPDELGTHSH